MKGHTVKLVHPGVKVPLPASLLKAEARKKARASPRTSRKTASRTVPAKLRAPAKAQKPTPKIKAPKIAKKGKQGGPVKTRLATPHSSVHLPGSIQIPGLTKKPTHPGLFVQPKGVRQAIGPVSWKTLSMAKNMKNMPKTGSGGGATLATSAVGAQTVKAPGPTIF